ncbi:Beta 1,3(4)-glucanase [Aphelenchoides besseyi]|nr:Beta 1,3(4)-glucanase [Aphelenchoides besseyi]
MGMIRERNNQLYIGVEHQLQVYAGARGRNSIRIVSKKSYNKGLFILDLEHLPAGQCGSWGAFWMVGADWPNNGELDIIEGVNTATVNGVAMHTNEGCQIRNSTNFTGQIIYSDCDVKAANQPENVGCSIRGGPFGLAFNQQGGGIYATEWTREYVRVWFFSHSQLPSDIRALNPQPSNWQKPLAEFTNEECDLDLHFRYQQIVFDVTFCGDWAAKVWTEDKECEATGQTCIEYVQHNSFVFNETYWLINSLQIYEQ